MLNILSNVSFIDDSCFKTPETNLLYTPKEPCDYSTTGSRIVDNLTRVAPLWCLYVNSIIPLDKQITLAQNQFAKLKQEYLDHLKTREGKLQTDVESFSLERSKIKKTARKYFNTSRKFYSLVPLFYKRTEAPRLTTQGSTLHGMKRVLREAILTELTKQYPVCVCDFDMSAAHMTIAASLKPALTPTLKQAVVNSSHFWDEKVQELLPVFNKVGVSFEPSSLRRCLKVSAYTSLNGGNPAGDERLSVNLAENAVELFPNVETAKDLIQCSQFKEIKKIVGEVPLLKEVSILMNECSLPVPEPYQSGRNKGYWCYTVDKVGPYKFGSCHLGISRVLQGFEVVLLGKMVQVILKLGGIPLSLDHDGALILFTGQQDPQELKDVITEEVYDFSQCLLNDFNIPVEAKSFYSDGQIIKL